MSCCKSSPNKESDDKNHSCGSGFKYMLLMLACCLAPFGAVLLLKQSGYEGAGNYLIFLLCPLMHLFMMKGMGIRNKNRQTTLIQQSEKLH